VRAGKYGNGKSASTRKTALTDFFSALTEATTCELAAKSRDAKRLVRKHCIFSARALARTREDSQPAYFVCSH
jgi:hypothetical protein